MKLHHVQSYSRPGEVSQEMLVKAIAEIESLPGELTETLSKLNAEQLATPTLPGKWTVSQVVHHIADSHMNAFIRCKLALTEDKPTIKPYEEAEWARKIDAGTAIPARVSAELLTALHARWCLLLKSLSPEEWRRAYFHPEARREFLMEEVACLYAWHGRNHLAHIHELMKAKGWI
ncbi:MAG: putative metal-dependent hydrolase [Leptospirales bacterium]|nr:putative metal-dependent hydrolase [Leptospirales bacterium]